MTRTIKHSCNNATLHHGLAVLAITQIGMMRGFRSSEGINHEVVMDEGEARGHAGEYTARMEGGHSVQIHTESSTGCWVAWCFTWPDLKLLSYSTVQCSCTGYELDL